MLIRNRPTLKLRNQFGHIRRFTKELALATLRYSGREVADCFYTSTRLELPNLSWVARGMRWPRTFAFFLDLDLAVRLLGGWSLMVLAKWALQPSGPRLPVFKQRFVVLQDRSPRKCCSVPDERRGTK